MNYALPKARSGSKSLPCPAAAIDQRRENLERRHEPTCQETTGEAQHRRPPQGRASLSWNASRALAVAVKVASPRRQALAVYLIDAAAAEARAVCRGAGQGHR